jgi:hypothetical protein
MEYRSIVLSTCGNSDCGWFLDFDRLRGGYDRQRCKDKIFKVARYPALQARGSPR